jgi:hypothetical protein
MQSFNTIEYSVIKGKEYAIGYWQYDYLPEVGDIIKIDEVKLRIKGVKKFGRASKSNSWNGKKIGLAI